MKTKILIVFGTRPEAIKMAPLIMSLKLSSIFEVKVCVTGQHREMLDQVLDIFHIKPDFDLDVMSTQQSLNSLFAKIISRLDNVIQTNNPSLILVHGDTTTSFAAALCAYHSNIKIAHIEAGLRSGNIFSPWPEEGNRILTSKIADYHFCPTSINKQNLIDEGIHEEQIYVTGNTVIDTLKIVKEHALTQKSFSLEKIKNDHSNLDVRKKIILITGHRRENFGETFEQIFSALKKLAKFYPDIQFVYPVHLNPKVDEPARRILSNIANIFLPKPLNYLSFIELMDKAYLVISDSGGIQEEAPSLGKPVLVLRENTERPEGIVQGTSILVGNDPAKIIKTVTDLVENDDAYEDISKTKNPYGDGAASKRIVEILEKIYS